MNAGVKIISKKQCTYAQPVNLVFVKQSMVIEEDGKKYLVLRLVNERAETVTGLELAISEFDESGAKLAARKLCIEVCGEPNKPFVPEHKIPLDCAAVDCRVDVKAAAYGKYTYKASADSSVSVEYGELVPPEKRTDPTFAAKAGKDGITVKSRKMRVPVLVIAALVLSLILATVGMYFYMLYFVDTEDTFISAGVVYEFENNDKSDGSNIIVAGYHGRKSRITVPAEIEGHKVISVKKGAFKDNNNLTDIAFGADIPVGEYAFENCSNLSSVDFAHIRSLGNGAFRNCVKLESVEINNKISVVPASAFEGCRALAALTVLGNDEDDENDPTKIRIGTRAFADCVNLNDVDFKRDIDFSYNSSNRGFFTGSVIGRLHLTSYDVSSANSANNTISALFGTKPSGSVDKLEIDYVSHVPQSFCEGLKVSSVKIGASDSSVIGNHAFDGNEKLVEFSFPLAITEVGDSAFAHTAITSFDGTKLGFLSDEAFYDCKALRSVVFTGNTTLYALGVNAFAGCVSLDKISVPQNVTEIAAGSFDGCVKLSAVNFARDSSITLIGDGAFNGCAALTEIIIPGELAYIGNNAFNGCAALKGFDFPDSLTGIGNGAFGGCKTLDEIIFPDGLQTVGGGVFTGCDKLEYIKSPFVGESRYSNNNLPYWFDGTAPESLKTVELTASPVLGNGAFNGCDHLETAILNDGITEIGDSAFYGCENLKSADIPISTEKIGYRAFAFCTGLKTFTVPNSVTEIGGGAFTGCDGLSGLSVPFVGGGETSGNTQLAYIFDYIVPESLKSVTVTYATTLGSFAFSGCYGVESIKLPVTLNTIYDSAFSGCAALKSLIVPDSVTSMGFGMLDGCSGLEELSMPFVGRERVTVNTYVYSNSDHILNYNLGYGVIRNLKKLTITDSEYFSAYAFEGGRYLEHIVLDCDVKGIFGNAFEPCYNLVEASAYGALPETFALGNTNNGGLARYALKIHTDKDDALLKKATVDGYRYVIDDSDNMYMLDRPTEKTTDNGVEPITDITLPQSVAIDGKNYASYKLWQYLFYNNRDIKSFSAPSGVVGIGRYAFYGCNNLERASFGATEFDDIPERAFCGCASLYDLKLPASYKRIGDYAFEGCTRIKKFYVSSAMQNDGIGDYAFSGCCRLFEIYNFSTLDISKDTPYSHGGITQHAVAVYDDSRDGVDSVTVGGVQYMRLGSDYVGNGNGIGKGDAEWWAVDYFGTGDSLEIMPFDFGGEKVNKIAVCDRAFENASDVKHVKIANVVSELGNVFGTDRLESVDIVNAGGGYDAINLIGSVFGNKSNLTTVRSNVKISTIGESAFTGCHGLSSVELAGVGTINRYAFSDCRPVGGFDFTAGNIDGIDGNAFGNSNVKTVSVGNVGTIGENAFSYCYSLTAAKFGSVGNIKFGAFYGCSALSALTLGRSDKLDIGASAFYGCSALKEFEYGGHIGVLNSYAFADSGVEKITLGKVDTIGGNIFVRYGSNSIFKSITFNGDVGKISDSAFYNCLGLSSITFNGDLNSLGRSAFANTAIKNIVLPDSLTDVPSYAFGGCVSLNEVTLPRSLRTLDNYAFNNCYRILSVYNRSSCNVTNVHFSVPPIVISDAEADAKLVYHAHSANGVMLSFAKGNGRWYLYDIPSSPSVLTLPDSFTAVNGDNVTSYVLRGMANYGGSMQVVFGKSVVEIGNRPFSSYVAYFKGSENEYRKITGNSNLSVYYYSKCLHDDRADNNNNANGNYWRYDNYNNPTRAANRFDNGAWTAVKAATCKETGIRELTCPDCNALLRQTIGMLPHNFGADGKCSMCDLVHIFVTSANFDSYFTNDKTNAFTIDGSNRITSSNTDANTSSELTFTADRDMYIKLNIRVSGSYGDKCTVKKNGSTINSYNYAYGSALFDARLVKGDTITFTYLSGSSTNASRNVVIYDFVIEYEEDEQGNA